ncbi:hypothetical protein CKN96_10490 [Carnobacterium maltaromaticum]|uniref:Bacteriophage Gp15 family protein n=2 Tax=Carnobacterium maltaromaticum TaxID=2751 RepID=K8EIA8_CARML|nr:bacteriophage Gp15 family protein [Carnobacterium maltaromaticum]TFJ56872.1 hypothetical protein CKN96_10490 [Carnobacterium maltaromaticum]CCO11573.2 bacteriophage Gp15 family protein [Carnobacterium maltaromaticum LMA28]
MMSLAFGISSKVIMNEKEYLLDLDFSTVLKMFEMFQDDDLNEGYKFAGVLMGVGNLSEDEINELTDDEKISLYSLISEKISASSTRQTELERDLAGNVLTTVNKQVYSLVEDASYIFASFYKDYKIDLIDMQGSLHWDKFNALLISLSDNTKFKKIIEIRQMEETKEMSSEQKEELRKAKKAYALKSNQAELEFSGMDIKQKREWYKKNKTKGSEV